jgi:hypothetical protein
MFEFCKNLIFISIPLSVNYIEPDCFDNCPKIRVVQCDPIFLDAFNSEWHLLRKDKGKISLLLIPRKLIDKEFIDYKEFVNDNDSLGVAVDKLINRKVNVQFTGYFEPRNIEFVELDYFKVLKQSTKVDKVYDKTTEIKFDEYAFSNAYGKVSILLLLGSLFVTLGVIITILSFWGN